MTTPKCLGTQIFRWSVQIQIYPPFSDEVLKWSAHRDPNWKYGNEFIFSDEVFRQTVRYNPPPPVSDEVQTETQTQNEEKSSYFQMKCPDSDIPPIVVRWSAQMKCTPRPKLEIWKVVHIFRWSVQISCQIYPASFRWSAHWDPNPKWGNEFIFLDGVSRSGVRWSEPDEVHMDIRYEFIFSDEVLR